MAHGHADGRLISCKTKFGIGVAWPGHWRHCHRPISWG